MTVWVVVVAAGRSERYGRAKQHELLAGRRVLDWSIAAARAVADGVVVVVTAAEVDSEVAGADAVVAGGATRSASVRAGLQRVPVDAEVIVVHDAARPAASPDLFRAVVAAVEAGATGAVPGMPLTDTVKRIDGDRVVETLERDRLVAVQTPQAFAGPALRAAHDAGADATDDAALVERAGGQVVVVAGDPRNLKLTEPADLARLEQVLGMPR